MGKYEIRVNVIWTGDNYCVSWADGQGGLVLVTAATLEQLKVDFEESLYLHIKTCIEDGDIFPEYLVNGNFNIIYNPDRTARGS